jgi:hypothetical protein
MIENGSGPTFIIGPVAGYLSAASPILERSIHGNSVHVSDFRYELFIDLFGGQSQAISGRCRDLDRGHRGRRLANEAFHFDRVSLLVSDTFGRGLSSTMADDSGRFGLCCSPGTV